MVSLTSLFIGVFMLVIVAGDDIGLSNRGKRSIISAIVNGLKNIHANLHKKKTVDENDKRTLYGIQ